jgi:hypothetical protein
MTFPTSDIVKELFSGASNEISELQKQLTEVEQIMVQEWEVLSEKLDANPQANIAASKFKSKFEQYTTLNSVLVKLYEKEIDKLQKTHVEDQISPVQKKQMLLEVKELENLCCLGLKSDGDIECFVHEKIFPHLMRNVEEKCPLLYSVLQNLLVPDARRRIHKTPEYKLKCGVNALALLLSVRNQKFNNDIQLLFGLLCISYGAGKQFINMLNTIGLSSHWDTMYVKNFCLKFVYRLFASVFGKR